MGTDPVSLAPTGAAKKPLPPMSTEPEDREPRAKSLEETKASLSAGTVFFTVFAFPVLFVFVILVLFAWGAYRFG